MHHGTAGMSMPSGPASLVASWSSAWGHWALMVGAMMFPVTAPHVRVVAVRSLWLRRHRSAALFLVGYVAVWLLSGAILLAVLVPLGAPHVDWSWVAATLVVAALWQVSGPRKRVLRRCGSLRLGKAAGVAADVDCARAGLRSGLRCLVTCWPAMLAMAMSHHLLLMAGVLAVMLTERARGANPMRRAGRPLEAGVLAGFASGSLPSPLPRCGDRPRRTEGERSPRGKVWFSFAPSACCAGQAGSLRLT